MRGIRTCFLIAAVLGATVLAGCGDSKQTQDSKAAITKVVTQFAAAHDASACNMLTDDALRSVYGGYTDPPGKAKRNCIDRSAHFKGQKVKVTQINFTDPNTAKAGALGPDGKISYTVTVRHSGTRWRIEQITQGKAQK